MHHLKGTGRDALHMRSHFIKKGHMALVAALEALLLNGMTNFIIAKSESATPMGSAVGQQGGLIGPQFSWRAHMRMTINDFHSFLPLIPIESL